MRSLRVLCELRKEELLLSLPPSLSLSLLSSPLLLSVLRAPEGARGLNASEESGAKNSDSAGLSERGPVCLGLFQLV